MTTDWVYRTIDKCRICSGNLVSVLNLGDLHVNAFPRPSQADTPKVSLNMMHCQQCDAVQLNATTNPSLLYKDYYYRSSTNETMRRALTDITQQIEKRVQLNDYDVVIDIGSNDGYLLSTYTKKLSRVGFEPSNIADEARKSYPEYNIIKDYFHVEQGLRKAKAITAIAMFYDLEQPVTFLREVDAMLDKDGLLVVQLAYLPSMLANNAFDGAVAEHIFYYSLRVLDNVFREAGFRIQDAEEVPINEGSIRLYAYRLQEGPPTTQRYANLRKHDGDIAKELWHFAARVQRQKHLLRTLVKDLVSKGKVVHAAGASTKANTLLQYYGDLPIKAIWERQVSKHGRVTVGTRIPIISEEEGRAANPDVLIVLPWHFAKEIVAREKAYIDGGGTIILPLPNVTIVDKNGARQYEA